MQKCYIIKQFLQLVFAVGQAKVQPVAIELGHAVVELGPAVVELEPAVVELEPAVVGLESAVGQQVVVVQGFDVAELAAEQSVVAELVAGNSVELYADQVERTEAVAAEQHIVAGQQQTVVEDEQHIAVAEHTVVLHNTAAVEQTEGVAHTAVVAF